MRRISKLKQNNFLNCLIYLGKSCGKMPNANPFISTVKAGRKLPTPPYILITKGKNSVANVTALVVEFQVLIYHKHIIGQA